MKGDFRRTDRSGAAVAIAGGNSEIQSKDRLQVFRSTVALKKTNAILLSVSIHIIVLEYYYYTAGRTRHMSIK
jgi:hypothetical protein